ncbi:hypothetical protein B0H10DRAFT_1071266 [Mycena sp. CBHHK59/15]|nr:hypothetical protein B0H10DRAFT_1071266 [Mycena sp. CBHHK59/15]
MEAQISELKSKLHTWLQCPGADMANKQLETEQLRCESTGGWLFDDKKFSQWKNTPGLLWIQGQSGTGKTVLSSTVIRKLFHDQQEIAQRAAVAYFYFDFRDQKKQLMQTMLRTIVLQLSAQSPHPYQALNTQYMLSKGQTLPNTQELRHVLEELLRELGRTYIIVDALDECTDTEHECLIDLISTLRGWTRTPLHLMMTSQSRIILTDLMKGVPCIYLESDIT